VQGQRLTGERLCHATALAFEPGFHRVVAMAPKASKVKEAIIAVIAILFILNARFIGK
jgi:hypothetical protein